MTGGFWAERLRTNRERTIPHGLEQLGLAGNLTNLRLAAGAHGRYRALGEETGIIFPFLDTDVYKWLEAVGWELGREPDRALADAADEVIGLVERAQRDDGYLNSYVQVVAPGREYDDLAWGHELYSFGHLIQAAIAWQRALGDDRLLRVATRAADAVDRELGPARAGCDRRPPRDRDGARRAVPSDRRASLPRAGRPDDRPARPRPARHRAVRVRVLAGPRPRPRRPDRDRARRPPAVSRLRRRRRRDRARRPPAARRGPPALARHDGDADLPDRRSREPPPRRGVRRSVRAAAGPGLRRDVRLDRLGHARLAAAARDRRPGPRRRHRTDRLQRGAAGAVARRDATSSTSTPCSAGPSASPRTSGPGRGSRGSPAPAARPT